ncbi:MAG TPA: CPBP family intramembrane metalloprotease, partial [Candidatus Paenibacillus intestinavium]|nr:CPBP family intramembrane metalloprotease [Candidatus Paenibacillus intestinavium]
LKTHYAMTTTIIIQAAIFAVIHVNPLQIIYTFILGLLFAWLVVSVNSLWASILMHMSFNLTTIVILRITLEKESVFPFLLLMIFSISSILIGIAVRLIKSKALVRNNVTT